MKYFTINELSFSATAQKYNIINKPSQNVIYNLSLLVSNILDPLREKYGKPIKVTSGYRCQRLNKLVGGSQNSQHLYGMAADIVPLCNNTRKERKYLFQLIQQMNLPFDQLINEKDLSWIHVSFSYRHRRQILNL